MINNNVYDSLLVVIKTAGVDIEQLYSYSKKMTNTEVKKETENIKSMSFFKPLKPGQSWADIEDEEEESKENDEESKEDKKEVTHFGLNFKNAVGEISEEVTEVEIKTTVLKTDMEEEVDDKDFKTKVSKKVMKHTNKKAPFKKTSNKNLPVVATVSEFIEMIRDKKIEGRDFTIMNEAHCEHTHNGTLCERVRACGKIHIQRCIRGDNCNNKNCSYIHSWDMLDDDAIENFYDTMEKYNELKSSKQVNH